MTVPVDKAIYGPGARANGAAVPGEVRHAIRNFRDNWPELAEVDSLAADAEARVRGLVEAALG